MGYIFVASNQKNTTSCGLCGNFQNVHVHNLFICYLTNVKFSAFSDKKKGGEF
jgi:hypothetical protein